MSGELQRFLTQHTHLSRRFFLGLGATGAAGWGATTGIAGTPAREPRLQEAIDRLESWLTEPARFRDVSRGKPIPHTLPEEKRVEVGLTRETWRLEVLSDPENPAKLRKPLTRETSTALDFAGLLQLAEKSAVRFPKVMTCLNIGCPLGMGVWEGVPLREVLWLTQPRENLRRVFYWGFHNDAPEQKFQSSLPVDRVLEDPCGLPPVILCYKLNGEWLTPERGGPVRVVVPEAYGFKSIKWVTTIILSNLSHANDTYAEQNNDVDSTLKTFASTLNAATRVKAGDPIAVTGYAQVGTSGLSRVQIWLHNEATDWPAADPHFTTAPWIDAEILPPQADWGGGLPDRTLLASTRGFDSSGQPQSWPMKLAKIHWAALLPGVPEGRYTLRCRTIDANGQAQPMPRPFQKSGHAAIEEIGVRVEP